MPGAKKSFTFQDVRKAAKSTEDARRMTVDAGEGLHLVLTLSATLPRAACRSRRKPPTMPPKIKAKLIASKVEGYDFRLPSNQAEILGWTITDLTDEQKN